MWEVEVGECPGWCWGGLGWGWGWRWGWDWVCPDWCGGGWGTRVLDEFEQGGGVGVVVVEGCGYIGIATRNLLLVF